MKKVLFILTAISIGFLASCGWSPVGKVYNGSYKNKDIQFTLQDSNTACISIKNKGQLATEFKTNCYPAKVFENEKAISIPKFRGALNLQSDGTLKTQGRDLGLSNKSISQSAKDALDENITLSPQ